MATTQQPFEPALKLDAERAWAVPVGAASPLWFAFFGAAATASTWWWMTRWVRELTLDSAAAAAGDEQHDLRPMEQAAATVAEEAGLVIDPVIEAPVALAAGPSAAVAAARETTDDLTRLTGIGSKLAAALAERGVTTFAQIAAWQGKDLDEVDRALSLKGRAVRDAWVSQARRLAGVQP